MRAVLSTGNSINYNMRVDIRKNVILSSYTTFKIGGPAKYFCEVKTLDELREALDFAKKNGLEIFVLGAGSNLLISDKGFDGLVVKVSSSKFFAYGGSVSGGQSSYLEAEAGVPLGKIVIETINKGLSGMEWAAGIPGTLGGAIRGNAGAFGGSMSDVIRNVSAVDLKTGGIKKFNNSKCLFAYRESVFKKRDNFLVWSAKLLLKKGPAYAAGNKKALKEKISEIMRYRQSRHPLDYPSFGSAFKNIYDKEIIKKITEKFPDAKENMEKWGDKIPAAYLIDKCGLKGKAIGGIMVSPKQPNFLLNVKNGKAQDAMALINIIKKSVVEKFGVILELEVRLVGFSAIL